MRRADTAPDPDGRLVSLEQVLRLPVLPRTGEVSTAAARVETLLTRLAGLTGIVRDRAGVVAWDQIDTLTARLLLSDLALIAADFQARIRATRDQFTDALVDLDTCRSLLTQPDDLSPDV